MDQPQRHVTGEAGHDLGQLRDLVGRGRVQVIPGVQLCAQVRVLLKGGRKLRSEVLDVESEDAGRSRETYFTARSESKRDGGNPGKGQEGICGAIQLQRLQADEGKCLT